MLMCRSLRRDPAMLAQLAVPRRRCGTTGACVLAMRMASSLSPAQRDAPATIGTPRAAIATATATPSTTPPNVPRLGHVPSQRRWQSGHQPQQAFSRTHEAPAQQPPPPGPFSLHAGGQPRPSPFTSGPPSPTSSSPSPFSSSPSSSSRSLPFSPLRSPSSSSSPGPSPFSSTPSSSSSSSSAPSPFSSSPSPFTSTPSQQPSRPARNRDTREASFQRNTGSRDRQQGDRTWGQLQRRASPQAGRGMGARGTNGKMDARRRGSETADGSRGNGNFWAELEARVGKSGGEGSRRGGPDKRRNMGGDSAASSREGWAQRGEADATPDFDAAFGPEPGVDVAALVDVGAGGDYDAGVPLSPYEHHRKSKKERPASAAAKTKTKPKPQARRAGYGGVEDEDLTDEAIERIEERRRRKEERRRQREAEAAAAAAAPVPILLPQFITVANLGTALGVRTDVFLQQLAELGFEEILADSVMTGETAALIAQEYGFEPTVDAGEEVDLQRQPPPADPSTVPARPPIVTIMGHVDHGKTTMLDWLRQSSVAAQEHGGITQHIGAFSVQLAGSGKHITFLDTPGHAAFLSMRQRGANVTDIVILVVAADDSVKPQTVEALKHARAAQVPLIVAINKVDKEEARVEQVKADLARHGVEIEDFGGDVQVVCVSGKTGQGMADLEESILTLAEILDVRAEPDGVLAEGWVLESSVKPVGRAATVLVKRGTLRRGDLIAAGTTWARVRVLRNEAGVEIDEAPPGTPVEILGWRELPDAGDEVLQAPSEARARAAIAYRCEVRDRGKAAADAEVQGRREREAREEREARAAQAALEAPAGAAADAGAQRRRRRGAARFNKPVHTLKTSLIATDEDSGGGPKAVNFTVKADVTGSVEAVTASILEIVDSNHEVRPQVLRAEAGMVTEFDVEHAAATNSAIVHFNRVPVAPAIRRMAEAAGVPLLEHTVIYRLVEDVRAQLAARLAPSVTTRVLGEAEVLQVFPINVRGRVYKNIAGCRVRNGLVARAGRYRVFRDGALVFEGKLEALRQGKKEVTEMRKGSECGMSFDGWEAMQEGDKIQMFDEVEVKREL